MLSRHWPSGNCTDVVANTGNGRWRSEQPGSMQSPNFETFMFKNGTIDACYLNATMGSPCGQGSVPFVGVNARSVEDMQAAVKFASKHNLRLVVKNTGHDYLGRSTARGSFLLWTHNLKNITYNEAFVPEGAPSTEIYKAITLGAGVQWYEAYNEVEKHGRFMVGGISQGGSVGAAGGWVMGGGHSAFAARYGLGNYLTVNAYTNDDLFWALRGGGGGGTYAVVLSATYRTHKTFPLTAVSFLTNFTSTEIAKSVITEYVKMHPALADAGWGGYSFLGTTFLGFLYVAPNISLAEANATIQPFVDFATTATGNVMTFSVPYDSFHAWYAASFLNPGQVGTSGEMGSRLLSRGQAKHNPEAVAEIMLAVEGGVALNFVAGGAVSKVDPDEMGLHPDWRKAVAHVYFSEEWQQGDPASVIQETRRKNRANLDILDRLAPGSATYFNEASLHEKNFKKTFFGSHYYKLKAIKHKYDPTGLFIVASGVRSDEWDVPVT